MKNTIYIINFLKKSIIIFCLLFISCYSFSQGESKTLSLAKEYKENVQEINKAEWKEAKIIFKLFYEGSDIPPAKMLLLNNSILVLQSRFFSPQMQNEENRFFRYKLENGIIELTAIDKRFNVERWINGEKYHIEHNHTVVSVNTSEKSVKYKYNNEFYFSGLLFYMQK